MNSSKLRVWPGQPLPLGADWDGSGTNFAIFSAHAEKVELCLFDETGKKETRRIAMPEYTNEIWHAYLPDVQVGQLYGYRVYGPYEPENGHRFNHHKLLLDPYAKSLEGVCHWDDAMFGYIVGDPGKDLSFDTRDSAPFMPKCRVVDTSNTWTKEPKLNLRFHQSVIYEMHVRGFTMRHPDVDEADRGIFAGLSTPVVIQYLKDLGVTAVELQPVHTFLHDRLLIEKGLTNYWGYNSIAYFAVHPDYLKNANIHDFKIFVQKLHNENIEVILDVVFNHTAEGNEMGPTLCFRGIDNKSYYDLVKDQPRYYNNVTGTGNTLKLSHPNVLRMVTDALRYWATEMKVDGYRFDLATALARVNGRFNEQASFLDAIAQDPLLSTLKLIAEPWDTGDKGYQLGRFPPGWAEWNDKYRDTVRRFWRGDPGQLAQLVTRLSGSGDLFNRRGRRPWSSINFVTAHDGFTLNDLVSYDHKHNEANKEDNRDGTDKNYSWNCGAEGPARDADILRLRRKQMRNFLATLFLSQGVPMLLAGDELARTQNGNNNAYCQDNETTWLNWEAGNTGDMLHAFTKKLIQLRRDHIVFHRARFFHGDVIPGTDIKDVVWLCPDAREMQDKDWHEEERKCIGVLISGEAGQYHLTDRGEAEPDDTYFVVLNASADQIPFTMPLMFEDRRWEVIVDTDTDTGFADGGASDKATYTVKPHSLLLFRKVPAE